MWLKTGVMKQKNQRCVTEIKYIWKYIKIFNNIWQYCCYFWIMYQIQVWIDISNIDELAALARGGAVTLSKLLANHNALGQLTNHNTFSFLEGGPHQTRN